MKQVVRQSLLLIALVSMFAICVPAQESVADAAKKAQSKKRPQATKVYTNDDIPSVVIPAAEKSPVTSAISGDTKSDKDATAKDEKAEKTEKTEKTDEKKSEESKADDFKKAIAEQKSKVADVEREVNLMEREHEVRVAAYYADAGNQLRNSKKWFDDEKKYQDDLAAKKKDLAAAKDKLAELQESARKSGVPVAQIE